MKFVQFCPQGNLEDIRLGYITRDDDGVVDISQQDRGMPMRMVQVLKDGTIPKLCCINKPNPMPLCSVLLVEPISGMDKILCVGNNFSDCCEENCQSPPPTPLFCSKFSSTIIGPNQPVRIRTDVCQSQDTFCPIGPYIVTADEIGDVHNLDLSCSVNGVEKQNSNTSKLIHTVPVIIERASTVMTLYPGDLILTGTPEGVGESQKPPEYLKPGDVIRSEIEKIGVLETEVQEFQ